MASGVRGLLDGLLGIADDYINQSVSISVKTNFAPEISLGRASLGGGASDPGGGGISLGSLIGFKAAVIVRDADGRELSTFGEPPPTEPVRVALVLVIVAGLAYLVVRGALK